jgi:hypothetical protein
MAANKKGGYAPSNPSTFNTPNNDGEIMAAFRKMKESHRVEVNSIFDINTFPSCSYKMKK